MDVLVEVVLVLDRLTEKLKQSWMNAALGHDLHCKVINGLGTFWANEMNFGMDHASGAGLIT